MNYCPKCGKRRVLFYGPPWARDKTNGAVIGGLWGGWITCWRCPGDWVEIEGKFEPCTPENWRKFLHAGPAAPSEMERYLWDWTPEWIPESN